MDLYEETEGYFVIPTDSLMVNKVTDFDIYVRVNGKYIFYRSKDIPFGIEEKDKLVQSDMDSVFVDVDDKEKYKQYLGKNLNGILSNQETSFEKKGKILLGTVAGDIHDIGKDIVKFLLDANGYDVMDLGIDVPPEVFVEKMKEYDPQIVALSGFLTLAFDAMKETIEMMRAAGMKESVKIMIGGGTIDERIVSYVGADAYGDTAMDAVKLADEWIGG